jgi:hypothetical protein
MEDAPLLDSLDVPVLFAALPQGFGAAELGFKGRQPWEGQGEGKNVRKRGVSVRREGVSEGGGGLAGPWPPSKYPLFFFSYFYVVLHSPLRLSVERR